MSTDVEHVIELHPTERFRIRYNTAEANLLVEHLSCKGWHIYSKYDTDQFEEARSCMNRISERGLQVYVNSQGEVEWFMP